MMFRKKFLAKSIIKIVLYSTLIIFIGDGFFGMLNVKLIFLYEVDLIED